VEKIKKKAITCGPGSEGNIAGAGGPRRSPECNLGKEASSSAIGAVSVADEETPLTAGHLRRVCFPSRNLAPWLFKESVSDRTNEGISLVSHCEGLGASSVTRVGGGLSLLGKFQLEDGCAGVRFPCLGADESGENARRILMSRLLVSGRACSKKQRAPKWGNVRGGMGDSLNFDRCA